MKKRTLIILASIFGLFLFNSSAIAGYLDSGWKNITTFDGYPEGYDQVSSDSWHYTNNEDNEVEPGATIGQAWDIEGFYLSDGSDENIADNELALVGGYDFKNGVEWGNDTVTAGDIFIDADMDPEYYEYVMDLNFETMTYDVIKSDSEGDIQYDTPSDSGISGPSETSGVAWKYTSGGSPIGSGIAFQYLQYASEDVGDGLKGDNSIDTHNIITLNLGFLGGDTSFKVLNTMACGNDVAFAQGSTTAAVPEPATIFLLGSGLLGLFGYRKKFRKTDK